MPKRQASAVQSDASDDSDSGSERRASLKRTRTQHDEAGTGLPTLRYIHVRSRAFSPLCVHLIARVLPFFPLPRCHPGHFPLLPFRQVCASLALDYRQSLFHSRSPLHSTVLPSLIVLQTAVKLTAPRTRSLQFGLGTHTTLKVEMRGKRPLDIHKLSIVDSRLQVHTRQATTTHDTVIRQRASRRVSRLLEMQGPPGSRSLSIDANAARRSLHPAIEMLDGRRRPALEPYQRLLGGNSEDDGSRRPLLAMGSKLPAARCVHRLEQSPKATTTTTADALCSPTCCHNISTPYE
ncbi:hypothetical protein DFP72DRAFT_1074149 [Ephemerocybe angulata]|uniref:Uncharacterized protein n=1 Tax=Ephemerocybe angulata TaxID=980116 RepID=A0A8H6HMQ3_9AGAR|nr:hypothetical protein DFP72DRAFT_1074149 [Tulosesus angulatus]